jgi:hypothetical protein
MVQRQNPFKPMKVKLIFILLFFVCGFASAQWRQTEGPFGGTINAIAIDGTKIFAGSSSGVFFSGDEGLNWVALKNGIPMFRCIPLQPTVQLCWRECMGGGFTGPPTMGPTGRLPAMD